MICKRGESIKQAIFIGGAFFCFGVFNYSLALIDDNFQIATWNVLHPKAYEVAIKARKPPSPIHSPRLDEKARDILMSTAASELVSSKDIICFQEFNYDKNGNDRKLFSKKDFSHKLIVPESYETKTSYGISYAAGVATVFDKTKFDLVGEPIWRLIKKDDNMHNLLFIKLKSKSTGSVLGIFNVHLPFTFLKETQGKEPFDALDGLIGVIQSIILEVKEKEKELGINYYIICGDFNLDSYKNEKIEEMKSVFQSRLFPTNEVFEDDKTRMTAIGSDNAVPKRFDYIFYAPSPQGEKLNSVEAYTYPELPVDIGKLVRHDQGSRKYEFSSDHAVVFAHFVGTREEKEVGVLTITQEAKKPTAPLSDADKELLKKMSKSALEARLSERLSKLTSEVRRKSRGQETRKKLEQELSKVAVEVAPKLEPVSVPVTKPVSAGEQKLPAAQTQKPKEQPKPPQSKGKSKRKRRKKRGAKRRVSPKKLKKKRKLKKRKKGKGRRGSHAKNKKSKH